MRVAVLGGTGVFGSRLARMLARDGHAVIVAARDGTAAARLSEALGGTALALDRGGDLSPLWAAAPEVLVDAAGPFHAYGADPYRLAREAVARGVHYLDLADDAGFCAGIAVLDGPARAAGVVALSGLSSVPALSSAATAALAEGLAEIDLISAAILPGNRAPRGRAVMEGILARAGTLFPATVDGRAEMRRNWADPAVFSLFPGDRRRAWAIEVPDQRLFPAAFGARTVAFRAGLELWPMGWGLALLSVLRGATGMGMPRWLTGLVGLGARALSRFGTDTGGMVVEVTGRGAAGWERRRWVLVARNGEGPFVPGVPVRAALRGLSTLAPGARPAVAVLPLAAMEAAMADLSIETRREAEALVPLFPRVLGPAFAGLPREVRSSHDHAGPRRWQGRAEVRRGRGWLARLAATVFRFPPPAADVAVEVVKRPSGTAEVWDRRFGDWHFRSVLRAEPIAPAAGLAMTERFGAFTFRLGLNAADGALHFPVVAGRAFGVPLPRRLLPKVEARETAEAGRMRFDVAMHTPFGGLIVHYRGWLAPAGSGDQAQSAASANSTELPAGSRT
jgi:hypothetical protein